MIKVNYALGIDVGGTSIKYGVIDNNGEVAVKYSMPLDPSETGLSVLKRLSQQINELKLHFRSLHFNIFFTKMIFQNRNICRIS